MCQLIKWLIVIRNAGQSIDTRHDNTVSDHKKSIHINFVKESAISDAVTVTLKTCLNEKVQFYSFLIQKSNNSKSIF